MAGSWRFRARHAVTMVLTLIVVPVPTLLAQEPTPEETEETARSAADIADVERVIERLFDGMRAADSAMVRSVFHPDARLATSAMREGQPVVSTAPLDGFIQAVGGAMEVWDERLHRIDVRVDGNLASAWMTYSFYRGEEFSHCGVNAMHLVRTGEGWRILQLTDTRRRDECAAVGS